MTKCQKEERGFYKTQKHELQLLPAAGGWFNKNELELFVEDWPRRPPPSPDASGLPAFPPLSSDFLLLFHFLHPAYFSFFCRQLPRAAGSTSRSVFTCRQNSTLSSFFSFKAFSAFHQPSYLLPALAGRILPASFLSIHKPELRVPDCRPHASRTFFFQSILSLSLAITLSSGVSRPYLTSSILTNSQARTSRSGLPAITSDISYLLNIQKPATHIRLCRPALLQSPTLPQTPSAIFRCLRATSFPLHFAAAFHSSNIPFFLFFLSSTLFLFLFFFLSFFFPLFLFFLLFIIFSLHFLFSRLFLFAFFISFSFLFFLSHHPARFLCAPAQRM